jgi:hypothetical protein
MIKKLGILLAQLTNADKYPALARADSLWIWCHTIAKYLERKLSQNDLRDLYGHFESEKGSHKGFPSKSLLILTKAHEVLGKERKCWKKKVGKI